MKIECKIENIADLLKKLNKIDERMDFSISGMFSIQNNGREMTIVSKESLQEVEINKIDNNCFLIEKEIYDLFQKAIFNKRMKPVFEKTEHYKEKTESESIETGTKLIETDLANRPENLLEIGEIKREKTDYTTRQQSLSESEGLYIIEEHQAACSSCNRPTAFAIKKMGENYYTLFYRKSVYDEGLDNAFHKYLSIQPGVLVAYKYCNSVSSIKQEFERLGLALRHNGKNELSKYQADQFLHTFSRLRFL